MTRFLTRFLRRARSIERQTRYARRYGPGKAFLRISVRETRR